jgi:gas vesicle protein
MGNNNNNTGRTCRNIFFVSLIAGFSGFVLGLLFAPESGRKFRGKIAEKFLEIIDRSKFAMVEARVKAEEFIDRNREKTEDDL